MVVTWAFVHSEYLILDFMFSCRSRYLLSPKYGVFLGILKVVKLSTFEIFLKIKHKITSLYLLEKLNGANIKV